MAQTAGADAILGSWINVPRETIVIEVFKNGNSYAGKITESKGSDSSKPVGFLIMDGLVYDAASGSWKNGKVHTTGGKTFGASATIKADGTLEVHGYTAIRFIGSRKNFKRIVSSK